MNSATWVDYAKNSNFTDIEDSAIPGNIVMPEMSHRSSHAILGAPGGSVVKLSTWQCRRWRKRWFSPWVGKIPWRRKWQLTLLFLLGKSHGQRSLVGYGPWDLKELDRAKRLSTHTHTHTHTHARTHVPSKHLWKNVRIILLFSFYWSIITLQRVDFCGTSKWISQMYACIPSLSSIPPGSSPAIPPG